jgi:hypothetical protein
MRYSRAPPEPLKPRRRRGLPFPGFSDIVTGPGFFVFQANLIKGAISDEN